MMGSCGKPKGQCTCGRKMTYNRKMSRYRTDNKKPERKFGNQTMRYAGGGDSKAAVQKYAQRYRNIGLNVRVVPHVGGYSLYFGEQRQGMARPPKIKPQRFNKEWRTLRDQQNAYNERQFRMNVGAMLPVKDIRVIDGMKPIPGSPDMGKYPMFDSKGNRIYLSAYTGEPIDHRLTRRRGQRKYMEMLEVLPPAYFMSNRKHDPKMDEWVMHNDADDPLYRTPEGDLVNTSDPEEGYVLEKTSMEDGLFHFWDFEHGPIPEDAPDWVGDEYLLHVPTGIKITRADVASGRATDEILTSMRIGRTPITRTYINTLEGDIAGGYAAMDNMDGRLERNSDGSYNIIKEPSNTTSEVPYRYEVLEYMTRMPDNFETFLMSELSSHTLTGESTTTQYAKLDVPGEEPVVVSKEVVVNDINTWIKPEDFQESYAYNGINNFRDDWKTYNSNKRKMRMDMKGRQTMQAPRSGSKRRQRKKKRYNHLQWYAPGNLKIIDKNVNGLDDRVE